MKKVEIIQSSQEPSPFNLWLNGDVLKKYTAGGWKSISSDDEKFYSKTEIDSKLIEYDATHKDLSDGIKKLNTSLDTLVNGESVTEAIDSYKEIEAFLQGITNTETLTGLLKDVSDSVKEDAANKYVALSGYQEINGIKFFNSMAYFNNSIRIKEKGGAIQFGYTYVLQEDKNKNLYLNALEELRIGSTNKYISVGKDYTFTSYGYKVYNGTANQFLKADGSVDDTEYLSEIPDNVVTTDTDQEIQGIKTFTDGIKAKTLSTTDEYFSVDSSIVSTKTGGIFLGRSLYQHYLRITGRADYSRLELCTKNGPNQNDTILDSYIDLYPNNVYISKNLIVPGIKITNGTSNQFLKADGSLDKTTYVKTLFTEIGYLGFGEVINSNTNYLSTDFIYINKHYPIKYISAYTNPANKDQSICFYDKDKNYISGIKGDTNIAIKTIEIEDIPENAVYVRVSNRISNPLYFYNGPASQADNAGIINAINEATSDLMTEQESSDLYNKIYAEILEEYGDEMNPNPLIDKDDE